MWHTTGTALHLSHVIMLVAVLRTSEAAAKCQNPEVTYKDFQMSGRHDEYGTWHTHLGKIKVAIEHTGKPQLKSLGVGQWEVKVKISSAVCATPELEDEETTVKGLEVSPQTWNEDADIFAAQYNYNRVDTPDIGVVEFQSDDGNQLPVVAEKPRMEYLGRGIFRPSFGDVVLTEYDNYGRSGALKLFSESLPWLRAKQRCEQDGAHLVSVDTQEKVDMLLDVFSRYPRVARTSVLKNQVYVGISDIDEEGVFRTATGELFSPWNETVWFPKQPDDEGGNEDCVTFHTRGRIRDVPCHFSLPFFCEIDYNTFK